MHDIEPYHRWRDLYVASEDERSPFHGRQYDEFKFTQAIYNYYIHPQWDNFGSPTLYLKVLFVDYDKGYTIIELIGEWNDAIGNDIKFLKRDLIDDMTDEGIHRFILICDNVLNFHGDDDCYYEEWYEDIRDEEGWICILNTFKHVEEEMKDTRLQYFVNFGEQYNEVNWRIMAPKSLYSKVKDLLKKRVKRLS